MFFAGQNLTAAALNAAIGIGASASDTQLTAGTTGSGAYTTTLTGGVACGLTFVAPASGKVRLLYTALMQNSGANFNYSAPQVRQGASIGSGTIVVTAGDDNAITNNGTIAQRYAGHLDVSGLTPGDSYNVQLMHHVTAGTLTVSRKHLSVGPLP